MKDQYFGDINDYRKYGLLRAIIQASGFRVLVAWMLTSNDESTDGKFISYLDQSEKLSHHDPELFLGIKQLSGKGRRVSLIENTDLLPHAIYYSDLVSDSAVDRDVWFGSLTQLALQCDMVFLDPDNGLEVKTKPYGCKKSSKFLYWHEVQALWSSGKSLLIYQHFIREKRQVFIQRMMASLRSDTPGSLVEAFSTPHVVFLMALQHHHRSSHESIVNLVQERWSGQVDHWELTRSQQ